MVQITKTIQPKHQETLSRWLKEYCKTAVDVPLSDLPQHLATFPTRWPFPRGDLYHWIPLLNRFDRILEQACKLYKLEEGPQTSDFGILILMKEVTNAEAQEKEPVGDLTLLLSIIGFSRMLLRNCGNRSLYASSQYLDGLLNTTSLPLLEATLFLTSELAQRYQAAVKRLNPMHPKHAQSALLSHYNINLERVTQLALPFTMTAISQPEPDRLNTPASPTASTTPSTSTKAKEKEKSATNSTMTNWPQNGTSSTVFATDLVSLVKEGGNWNGWGNVKLTYYPKPNAELSEDDTGTSRAISSTPTAPVTPTPRRSSNLGPHAQRHARLSGSDDTSPILSQPSAEVARPNFKNVEISVGQLKTEGVHQALSKNLTGLPEDLQYQLLHKLRVASALITSPETRRQILAIRLLGITNLAYVFPEPIFLETVTKQDGEEPRRLQLAYQLAELVHPTVEGVAAVPTHIQSIVLATLDALGQHPNKYQDVCTALNTNVNHGVLLYVVRTAAAELTADGEGNGHTGQDGGYQNGWQQLTEKDEWRDALFTLISGISVNPRTGGDLIAAGIIPIVVEVLALRNAAAQRYQPTVVNFLDNIMFSGPHAFQTLADANGLDAMSSLIVHEVSKSEVSGNDLDASSIHQSTTVDYKIPFFQRETLRWLFKFIHHMMSAAGSFGANSDRLLRNLIDSAPLLSSMRTIFSNASLFGSVVWTNAITILNDFINNEPTSFAVIAEAGLSRAFLEAITNKSINIPINASPAPTVEDSKRQTASGSSRHSSTEDEEDAASSHRSVASSSNLAPQRPSLLQLQTPRSGPLARGIMPTAETISIIPQAFGAISLNNDGRMMLQECGALESFFEIFESESHVKCMNVNKELPSTLGSLFDELVRHHPPLKKPILNASLNMVTRVSALCKSKGQSHKLGAKLWTRDSSGAVAIADQDILASNRDISGTGKGKAIDQGSDVEMKDADSELPPASAPPTNEDSNASMIGYINALANFLQTLFQNTSIRSEFCASGGAIDIVLDLADSPCLGHEFADSSATRNLRNVMSMLGETKPHLTLPSMLRRAQSAVDVLAPLANYNGDDPFFKAFISKEAQELADPEFLAKGTSFVKAFVNLYSLVSAIHSCLLASSYSGHRSPISGLGQLNLGDYYVRLVQTLGPLVGAQFRETFEMITYAPAYYKISSPGLPHMESAAEILPDTMASSDATSSTTANSVGEAVAANPTTCPTTSRHEAPFLTKADRESPEYKNFQVLHHLLRKMTGTLNPFFQILGRSLVSKRQQSDLFQKQSHVAVADALAESILRELAPRGSIDNTTRWMGAINGLQDMLIDHASHSERPVQTITLVLQAFKDRGGFDVLNDILESMAAKSQVKSLSDDKGSNRSPRSINAQVAGLATQNILSIYNQLVNGKNVTDAVQTISMVGRENSGQRSKTTFSAAQFLVELRMAVLPVVRRLWESDLVETEGSADITKSLIEVLRTIGNADSEGGAFKRADKRGPISKVPHQSFNMSPSHLKHLVDEENHDRDLAQEALYRCNNNLAYAVEYCTDLKGKSRPRYPIPESDRVQATETAATSRPTTSHSGVSSATSDQTPATPNAEASGSNAAHPPAEEDGPLEASVLSAIVNSLQNQEIPNQITLDDLDEERTEIRETLIDRCLEVTNAYGDLTFEVADLIQTFASKSPDKEAQHQTVAETLVLALISFGGDEDIRTNGKNIAAYAHLLALLLREKTFYAAAVGELKANLPTILGFIKLAPDHSAEEPSPWIAHILLIVEMLLSQDARPRKTKWTAPKDDNDTVQQPIIELGEMALPIEERNKLLEAIMDVLPRVGKDESLALSVLRILVILTRTRSVALLVGEKNNLQRLFVMAKQLAGVTSSRHQLIHGPLMLILRHVIEDEDTIRQMIRTDIQLWFESAMRSSSQRHISLQQFLQGLAYAVIRSPEVFVEVTNELVKYGRWSYHNSENPNRSNTLVLKTQSPLTSAIASKSDEDTVQPTVQATEDLTLQDVQPSTEGVDVEMQDTVKPVAESKFPIVENPDSVIHFLLCELLKYRDVQEPEPVPLAPKLIATNTAPTNGDTVAAETSPSSMPSSLDAPPAPPNEASPKPSKVSAKLDFKAEEHSIFIYRCLLLQCLTELVGSYNRTKLEFINFKRNAPPQAFTPSKPRSSVTNYLLFDLIPVGTLDQADSISLRKKLTTSHWADSLLTALLSKTGEHLLDRTRDQFDGEDEPNLQFVRKFVLDHILKAYREASASTEPLDAKYARMYSLAELIGHLMNGKEIAGPPSPSNVATVSQKQIRRMMFEKGFIPALTASIADVDLNFPGAKRAVKHILKPLKSLTSTAITLSAHGLVSTTSGQAEDDEIESATSVSDAEEDREETPDLFRNSTLGMFEPGREEDSSSSGDSEDDDPEMYEEGYEEEMDYDEEPEDAEDNVSEDEDIEGMGEIEGLDGDHGVDVEVIMDDEDDDDEDDDDEDESSTSEDDEEDDARVEIIDEAGEIQQMAEHDMDMDGWDTDEEDDDDEHHDHGNFEGQDDEEDGHRPPMHLNHIGDLLDALGGPNMAGMGGGPMDIQQQIDDRMEATMGIENEAEREAAADLLLDELELARSEDDDDEEDDEMFMGVSVHNHRQIPFGWDSEFNGPVIISRGPGRHVPPIPCLEQLLETTANILDRHRMPPAGFPDMWPGRGDPLDDPADYRPYRSHRPGQPQPTRAQDDGTNPLLQRHINQVSSRLSHDGTRRLGPLSFITSAGLPGGPSPFDLMDLTRGPFGATPSSFEVLDMMRSLQDIAGPPGVRGSFQFHVTGGHPGDMPRDIQAMFGGLARRERIDPRRETSDPLSMTFFTPHSTAVRWNDEGKMLFGGSEAILVVLEIRGAIEFKLVPPAIEVNKAAKAAEAEKQKKLDEERKKKEEAERIAREAKEQEEKLERKRKEEEAQVEAERVLQEAAEAAKAAGNGPETTDRGDQASGDAPEAMEGVENEAQSEGDAAQSNERSAADRPRVTTMIRGNPFDITDLGIDAEFLAELPEELREEVIMATVAERRSAAAATGSQPTEIDQEFLDALPDDIRDEIIQQERQERRRREREEQRRAATAASGAGGAAAPDMDAASILATLPAALRQQILLEQDEETISQLPPDLADQARNLLRSHPPHPGHRMPPGAAISRHRPLEADQPPTANQRKPSVQMLDKSGIATLLRMMFTFQHPGLRTALNAVLENISSNKQNRIEVLSTLLHVLQDGSADTSAVERSFAHLSLRAKQPPVKEQNPKTPQPLKRNFTGMSASVSLTQASSEASPLMVVHQCLAALSHLTRSNPHVNQFFLADDKSGALKRTLSKKGKGKDDRFARFPLNSLLSLLDRDLIMDSSPVMELLSTLLSMITISIPNSKRKIEDHNKKLDAATKKEAEEKAKSEASELAESSTSALIESGASVSVVDRTISADTSAPAGGEAFTQQHAKSEEPPKEVEKMEEKKEFITPVVPDQNLKLVINIFVARECSSRTFRETLSTIKNLSIIPGAKSVFGRELITKAQALGEVILVDLEELLPQIQKAVTGTEIQGVALAKFSPGGSDQNKLLRVLTALDHLFDPKRDKKDQIRGDFEGEQFEKQDLLSSLYENSTFGPMWEKLSACLSAIRQREHMLNVATILLPLIEALMVVCKNTTSKDKPAGLSLSKDMLLTSPDPESRMDTLFFSFTEEHRKILNDLVRHTPKLMSGTFSLLVKNPKVLEFDNKRNYFTRVIHNKTSATRNNHPPLQLNVRRDQIFHDSFRSLYFQNADQMKYGKLNIRFNGEEGVDAGGVTREWFQALSRQMFNPDYALFIPVSSDRTTFHPNQLSSINDEHLRFFKFIGRIIGKALYENRVLDCHFSRAVYKRILGKSVSLKDMESLDPDYHKSLVWMLDNDITDIITETFSVDNDKFGVVETIDFKPNGRNIPVTEENKKEYVRLMVEWKLTGSVKEQLDEFLKGFHDIIPAELVAIFNEQELELLISGLPEIDVDDWKSNTEYQNYSASSPQIQWFWRAIRSYDKEERAKLLQFVTGTSKVPLNGFKELEGMNGFSRFNIHRDYGNKERLPSSHTCFNQLDLPEYESYEALRSHLLTAITAGSSYFGFA
ncbi:hypothetical protein BJ878DRAFT_422297 [Calycina marina]|uniref:HECT-type E3 ubiquitin transferase n=1 Tax=Calycina marina TaxID=1763456 RepID=A0A9P8CG37_9HELO|nr:hypothetical protein BJ878DRAFT_422297 [Calycina marina]